ncbi:MAG: hypothetical protein M3O70_16885 [Actinomycetota bacterium]|nr:hypothetical protein [Actinomycetota bacterium]
MAVRELEHGHPFDRLSVERARSAQLPPEEANRLAEVLTILSEPVRVRVVLALLSVEELCVGDIALAARSARARRPTRCGCFASGDLAPDAGTPPALDIHKVEDVLLYIEYGLSS